MEESKGSGGDVFNLILGLREMIIERDGQIFQLRQQLDRMETRLIAIQQQQQQNGLTSSPRTASNYVGQQSRNYDHSVTASPPTVEATPPPPVHVDSWQAAEQMRIQREQAAEAARLQREAEERLRAEEAERRAAEARAEAERIAREREEALRRERLRREEEERKRQEEAQKKREELAKHRHAILDDLFDSPGGENNADNGAIAGTEKNKSSLFGSSTSARDTSSLFD